MTVRYGILGNDSLRYHRITMNDYVRAALQLDAGPWPPDYYTLLGLPVGEHAAEFVEAAVLERMERLRAYQIAQPEAVTEAMNLLARALITLSDNKARLEYDAELAAGQPRPEMPEESYVLVPLGVLEAAPRRPRRRAPRRSPPVASVNLSTQSSLRDRVRGLVRLRKFRDAWESAGGFFSVPDLAISSRAEAINIIAALREVAGPLNDVVAEDGPGGRLVTLAQARLTVSTLAELSEGYREVLADDWTEGRAVIAERYSQFRTEVGRHGPLHHVRRWLTRRRDRWPEAVVAAAALVAVAVALARLVTG